MAPQKYDDEELDGCAIDFSAEAPTSDEDLPETTGGVGSPDEETDGCDVDFGEDAATPDEDLPETVGGVA